MAPRDTRDRSGGFPDEVFFNPESLARRQQELNIQRLRPQDPDRGLFAVGMLLVAGVAGYSALRHWPKKHIQSVVGDFKKILLNPSKFGLPEGELTKLRQAVRGVSDVIVQQPWAHVRQDKFGQVLGSSRAAQDPTILNSLKSLREIMQRNPKLFPNAAAVATAPKQKYIRPIPQDWTGLRRLNLGDLFDSSGAFRQEIWGPNMPGQIAEMQNVVKDLVKIPGLKQNQKLMDLRLDPGMFMHTSRGGAQRLVNLSQWHPGNALWRLGETAARARAEAARGRTGGGNQIARLANWMAELVLPGDLMGAGSPFYATHDPKFINKFVTKYFPKAAPGNIQGILVSQGDVLPIFRGGGIGSTPAARGVQIGRSSSRMGMMERIRTREIGIRHTRKTLGRTAADEYIDAHKIDPDSWKAHLARFGEKLGVGPQFRPNIAGLSRAAEDFEPENIPKTIWDFFKNPISTARQTVSGILKPGPTGPAPSSPVYLASRSQMMGNYHNFLLHRVGHLLGATTGLGIKPGVTYGETLRRWAGLGVAGWAGISALQYADYASRNLIGTGPISAPLQAYAFARTAQQAALSGVGVQQGAEYLENLMPGLVDSPISRLTRAVVMLRLFTGSGSAGLKSLSKLAGRVNLQTHLGQLGGNAAAAGLAFTQLTDITQDPRELAAIYAGERDVEVRESRFWALGLQPFTGGRVKYRRPHFIANYMARTRDIGVYGSEANRWASSFLPTPESWFGLRPLLDPYAVERANYQTRPYPVTSPMFEEVPLVGPMLGATIGQILKPSQRWHQGHVETFQPGPVPGAALGLGQIPLGDVARAPAGDPYRPLEVIGKQIDILRDFLGMPGFLMGALKQSVTGESDFNVSNRQLASSGAMTSWARSFYEMQLGGGLGMTEMFRRFVPRPRGQIEQVNPIPNVMPSWLPGSFSIFPGDRDAGRDFHRGDPYTAVEWGEARLPGPAYEALRTLHSGKPGVYDAYDRWKILKDVAPTSQAFRFYNSIVQGWAGTRRLDESMGDPAYLAQAFRSPMRALVTEVVDGDTIVVDMGGNLTTVRIAGGDAPEMAHRQFELSMPETVGAELAKRRLERTIAGREINIQPMKLDPHGRLLASVSTGTRDISQELREAFPNALTDAQMSEVNRSRFEIEEQFQPYPFTERIFNNPNSRIPRNMREMTNRSMSAINKAIVEQGEFSALEKQVGRAWESMSHISLPGPLNWPINKLFPQRDALEFYRMQTLGAGFADWATPIQSYVTPWANQMIGAAIPSYIPNELQQQRAAEEVIDMTQYMRMGRMQQQAFALGRDDLAGSFRARQDMTMTGALLSGQRRYIRAGLPRKDRAFYTPFIREQDPERRRRILEMASPMFGSILKQAWGGDVTREQDTVRENLRVLQNAYPKNWAGWHPDYPLHAMKVKTAHMEGWDIHDLGLSQREEYAAEELFSGYNSIATGVLDRSGDARANAYRTAASLRLGNVSVSITGGLTPGLQIRMAPSFLNYDRHHEMWDRYPSRF